MNGRIPLIQTVAQVISAVALVGLLYLEIKEFGSERREGRSPAAASVQVGRTAPPVPEARGQGLSARPSFSPDPQMATTTVQFAKYEHDFGQIRRGERVRYVFRFVNTGDNPLVIYDVKTGCGCTVPSWTREPIPPGESGEIVVEYDGSGFGKVTKEVHVFANVENSPIILRIHAMVGN